MVSQLPKLHFLLHLRRWVSHTFFVLHSLTDARAGLEEGEEFVVRIKLVGPNTVRVASCVFGENGEANDEVGILSNTRILHRMATVPPSDTRLIHHAGPR